MKKKHLLPKKELKARVLGDGISRTTLSFYRYVRIDDPYALKEELINTLGALGCHGRIYVASEGINAQMNVPKEHWDAFDAYIQSKREFVGMPYKIAVEETDTVSFYKLTVKVKKTIVADGITDPTFDVTQVGEYLTAEEMNEYVHDPEAIVVDMRNGYESEVGHFKNAITPDVDTFREELRIIPELLTIHKNKKIALYCTGGIRCEKASAWLRHNGFTDVKHLKGGIIDYKRQVDEKGLPNLFVGKNFVFDERMGERISDDVISYCHLCRIAKSDTHVHCKNQTCHVLFLSCDACGEKKKGYCSYRCMTFDALPQRVKKFFARNNHKKKLEQFKKHRLKSVTR
jgi:UPF0176 protein